MKTTKKVLKLKKGVKELLIFILLVIIIISIAIIPTPKDKTPKAVDLWGNIKEVDE